MYLNYLCMQRRVGRISGNVINGYFNAPNKIAKVVTGLCHTVTVVNLFTETALFNHVKYVSIYQ